MLKLVGILSALVSCSMLVGCASIVDGTHQELLLTTTPVSGAHCILTNNKGKWYVKSTPGHVKVHRSYQPLDIICKKHNYRAANKKVQSKTKGMAFGNIVFGGLIGAGVDAGDGAAYDYPESIVVPMHKVGSHPIPKLYTGDEKSVKLPVHAKSVKTAPVAKKAVKPAAKKPAQTHSTRHSLDSK